MNTTSGASLVARQWIRWVGAVAVTLGAVLLGACGGAEDVAPTISAQPQSLARTEGQTASFTVAADGTAPLSYAWQSSRDGGTTWSDAAGANAATHTTAATTMADDGVLWRAVVSNAAGSVNSAQARLTVTPALAAPTISQQPLDLIVTAGQTATLSVTAAGSGPLSYQWRRDGTNVAGATANSYAFAAALADHGAVFSVVVSGPGGSVTSNAATLSVTSGAPITGLRRVSVASDGSQANGRSQDPQLSADGRYVVFRSSASNLVLGDTNGVDDIFVHDAVTGQTTRVSVASNGDQANSPSGQPSISADGRYVVFLSSSTTLVLGKTTSHNDVFVHDRQTGQTTRPVLGRLGEEPNDHQVAPFISGDGNWIVFQTQASNLGAGDPLASSDVFLVNRGSGQILWAGSALSSTIGTSLATDGQVIQALSHSGDAVLIAGGMPGWALSVCPNPAALCAQGNRSFEGLFQEFGLWPAMAGNGSAIAFGARDGARFVPNDSNGLSDLFVYDYGTLSIQRISVASDGTQADGTSLRPYFSRDGRYVSFWSYASNLIAGTTTSQSNIFVRDRQTNQTRQVSLTSTGAQPNGINPQGVISADGSAVAITSAASNLVPGDSNGEWDIFIAPRP